MKKNVTLIAVVLFVSLTQTSVAQEKKEKLITAEADTVFYKGEQLISARKLMVDTEKQTTTLEGDVSFAGDKLTVTNAGKVVIHKKTKKITVYDPATFTMKGQVVIDLGTKRANRLEYTIGDDTVYIY